MTTPYPQYDTWEHTEAALRAAFKLIHLLHENKPAKGSAAEKTWEAELVEVRAWALSIHNRRIDLNVKELAAWRKNQPPPSWKKAKAVRLSSLTAPTKP